MKELVRYKKGLNVLPVWGTYARQSDPGFVCLFRLQSGFLPVFSFSWLCDVVYMCGDNCGRGRFSQV